MKKRFVNLIAAIVAIFCGLFAFSACSKVEFKVNFVVDGAVYATLNTNGEEIIKMPENPTKDDYDFDGWYWDKDVWQKPFTANSLLDAPLSSDMNVYCKWKPKAVHVSGISLNKSEVSLHVNETEILTATITPENATDTSVLWESSNATIATVTGGKITALRVGSATITATANDGGQIATCKVYVTPISVESVSLNYTQLSMLYGESKTLTASVTPQNATETGVIWKSSNASVVAGENGKLTATGYGSAVITATTADGGKTATCAVEVIDDTITFKTLQVAADGETVYGKVSNATTTFSFLKEIEEHGNATYQVYEDRGCTMKIVSKTIDLLAGDNTVYILQNIGEKIKLYTVTVRRRPIYAVSFDTDGGTAVQSQQVEEDSFVTAPAESSRIGYTFARWNYDFSQAITQDTEIKAVWSAHTDTKYRVEYYWENVENDEYTLHETSDLQGTTDTTATAEQKTYEHFTLNAAASTMQGNIAGDGSLVLKAYYTRNIYFVSNSNTDCGSITIAGSKKYGESVSTKATPKNFAYEFLGWFSGETLLCEESEYAFTAEQDVTAKFQLKEGMAQFKFNATADTCEITGMAGDGIDQTLQSLVIPDCVTSIGSQAFYDCRSLQSVTIGNNIKSIGDRAFYRCYGITSVTIGTGLSSVGDSAFYGCYSLTDIFIKDIAAWCRIGGSIIGVYGAKDREKNLFLKGERVTDLVIPYGVESIWAFAFYKVILSSVTIQDSKTLIAEGAFNNCSITQATIPATSIACLKNNSTLQNVTLTGEGKIEGALIFKTCSNLESVVINKGLTSIGDSLFNGCKKLTSVTIPDKVTSIGEDAFLECVGLKSITIPDSVTSIGGMAFYRCSNLTSIEIPDKVTSIGYYAFGGCSNLTSVTIGNSVTSIGHSAFYNCSSLASITIPNSVTSVSDVMFYGCGSLTSLTIPNSVTSIGGMAFYNCSKLTSIEIPDKVTSIGKEAFLGCIGLTSVTIGNSVTTIGSSAFYNCSNLTSIEIPDKVTSIDLQTFMGCSGLTSITIPDKVTSIGNHAFDGCSGLTNVTIGNSVTTIDYSAFYNCSKLTSVTIGNSVTSIGNGAFENCSSLTSITIPDKVTSIGKEAFGGCSNLTSVTIGNSVKSIGSSVFSNYTLLKVYYKGTAEEWGKIDISDYFRLTKVTRYYSEEQPTGSDYYWHYNENGEIEEW